MDVNEKNPVYAAIGDSPHQTLLLNFLTNHCHHHPAPAAPLRLLLLKKSKPALWSMITSLMDHNEDRFDPGHLQPPPGLRPTPPCASASR